MQMHQPTILLAEDDPVIALDLQTSLEKLRFQVVAVDVVEELQSAQAKYLPELIILNHHYPGGQDMGKLAQILLAAGASAILCITGARIQETEIPYRKDPRVSFLYKPFTRAQLHANLKSFHPLPGTQLP